MEAPRTLTSMLCNIITRRFIIYSICGIITIICVNDLILRTQKFKKLSSKSTGEDDFFCPAFIPQTTKVSGVPYISEEHKLSYCSIPKVCTTKNIQILEVLYGIDFRSLTNAPYNFTGKLKKLSPNIYKTIKNDNDWSNLFITRDPIDRFISGYVNKCLKEKRCAKGCDLRCFIKSIYGNFTNFVTNPVTEAPLKFTHWFPMSWKCKVNKDFLKWTFLRYSHSETFVKSLKDFYFNRPFVDQDHILKINKLLLEERKSTYKSGSRKKIETKLLNPNSDWRLLDCLLKIYDADYKMFNKYYQPAFAKYQRISRKQKVTGKRY